MKKQDSLWRCVTWGRCGYRPLQRHPNQGVSGFATNRLAFGIHHFCLTDILASWLSMGSNSMGLAPGGIGYLVDLLSLLRASQFKSVFAWFSHFCWLAYPHRRRSLQLSYLLPPAEYAWGWMRRAGMYGTDRNFTVLGILGVVCSWPHGRAEVLEKT